ncbi:hypothetical protein EV363DRAFT_408624 [Boletus edulis]|nr:hypothetical protein EV363DRAFT_408624 [Boletus edulis]
MPGMYSRWHGFKLFLGKAYLAWLLMVDPSSQMQRLFLSSSNPASVRTLGRSDAVLTPCRSLQRTTAEGARRPQQER